MSALLTAVLAFASREALITGTGWLARHIILRAAKRLPEERRELRLEEWLAEYHAIVAKGLYIAGVLHACGTYVGAVRIAGLRGKRTARSRPSRVMLKRMLMSVSPSSGDLRAVGVVTAVATLMISTALGIGYLSSNPSTSMAATALFLATVAAYLTWMGAFTVRDVLHLKRIRSRKR